MSFQKGSIALTIFKLKESLPENYLELFSAKAAGKLDDVKDEPQIGWVSGRHLLETKIDDETAYGGGSYFHLNLRTAEKKIPSSFLSALCTMRELLFMQEEQIDFVPSKKRKEIKQDVVEDYTNKMTPTLTGIPFVVDSKTNILYLGTGSLAQIDNFIAFFIKTVNIEPIPMCPKEIVLTEFKEDVVHLPIINFSDSENQESEVGFDFLTWLWYSSEKKTADISLDNFGKFHIFIEAPLTLTFSSDDVKGAGETTVKKGGNPSESAEVKAALKVGKKLKKAKLWLCRDEDMWKCTFDAEKFNFSGLQLPEGEQMDSADRFAERITNLHIFQLAIKEYFILFVKSLKSEEWNKTELDIRTWASERKSY